MLLTTLFVFVLVRVIAYILGVLIANSSALISLFVVSIFIGIALCLIPSRPGVVGWHNPRRWGIVAIIGGAVLAVASESLADFAPALAVVLAIVVSGTLVFFIKRYTFRFLKGTRGAALPIWLIWVLRLI